MAIQGRRRLESALLKAGLINTEQLNPALKEHKIQGKRLSKYLIDNKLITEEDFFNVLEEHFKIPRIEPAQLNISPETAALLPEETAKRLRVMPLSVNDGQLTAAMTDPLDLTCLDDLTLLTGMEINPVAARESTVNYLITQFYGIDRSREGSVVVEEDSEVHLDEAPVIGMVNSLIERAVDEEASDIHLEPAEDTLRVRLRLDGILHDLIAIPGHASAKIVSRVKIMANLDIAERRLPQDGNINWQGNSGDISLRVSTLPTVLGEKVVIRLLEREKIVLPLEELGFSRQNYSALLGLLLNHAGLLLVTGPTGCGKTTTLYSALHYLNRPEDNIITVEDPVECRLKGINQVQVNQRINRTFANALRSILRQDPDVVMVGEIRDLETAKITTQAAFTGHLVLSTLHTNNAAGAVTRLIDMGLADYLVTASLVGVIAQRLVRKICKHCKEEYILSDDEKHFYRHNLRKEPPQILTRGTGCRFCNNTGYRGRTSIQEVMVLDQQLQDYILQGVTAEILQQKAIEQGMTPLILDGLWSVENGITTVNEVVRTTFSSIADNTVEGSEKNTAVMARLFRSNI
ncbi:MAG: GspE/PulE family protein [Bacillota bacterium]